LTLRVQLKYVVGLQDVMDSKLMGAAAAAGCGGSAADFFVAVPMQPDQSLKDYLIATARRNDPHYVHQMVHKAHASATEKRHAKIIKGLKELVQALKAKVAELKKDSADEIGQMQELVKEAQAAAEAAASRSFALDPNLLEKRANGVTCPSTEKMSFLSQQVLAGRMPEAHVMENLHAAFVFFTGREPPPEAKTGASCVGNACASAIGVVRT